MFSANVWDMDRRLGPNYWKKKGGKMRKVRQFWMQKRLPVRFDERIGGLKVVGKQQWKGERIIRAG